MRVEGDTIWVELGDEAFLDAMAALVERDKAEKAAAAALALQNALAATDAAAY